jgi:hypothetical protein
MKETRTTAAQRAREAASALSRSLPVHEVWRHAVVLSMNPSLWQRQLSSPNTQPCRSALVMHETAQAVNDVSDSARSRGIARGRTRV